MSNVSIYEKQWIDLVFEGKNQKYGAYQLRQESDRTTVLALFSGMLLVAAVGGIFILSSFISKPAIVDTPPVIDEPIIVVDYKVPPKVPIEIPKAATPLPQAPKEITPFTPLVIVKPIDATDPVPTNNNVIPNTPTGPTSPTGTGTIPTEIPTGTGKIPVDPNAVTIAANLDYLPEYPGGIIKFREYIANNFEKPELDGVSTVKVLMSFVIEKDGSLSDIKVLRNPGYGLDVEAIRVLKSLKTKWKPGLKDGQKMRTQYTLPITVQMN